MPVSTFPNKSNESKDASRAVLIRQYGEPAVYEGSAMPNLAEGEVLIAVTAAGINPIDWKIRDGLRHQRMPLPMPVVLGCDIAGTVESVGAGVTALKVGDRVFGMVGLYGGFRQHVAISASKIVKIPSSLSDEEAASIPLAALTAWQALEMGGLKSGERVLIHAGAGGVGGFAIQIAKAKGAIVVTTASASKKNYVIELGADQVIDYKNLAFEDVVEPVDLVIDLIGDEVQKRSWQVLKPGGRLITTVLMPDPGQDGRPMNSSGARVGVKSDGAQLAEVASLVEQGNFKTHIEHRFPIERAQDALELNKAGGATGKIVLNF